jgi:head-tail adaptor
LNRLGEGPIHSGELRESVAIEVYTTERDALNQPVKAWESLVESVRARVRYVRGQRSHLGDQIQEPGVYEVRIRRGPLVTKLCRVRWSDLQFGVERILRIDDVVPLDTRDGMDLVCIEGLSDG